MCFKGLDGIFINIANDAAKFDLNMSYFLFENFCTWICLNRKNSEFKGKSLNLKNSEFKGTSLELLHPLLILAITLSTSLSFVPIASPR